MIAFALWPGLAPQVWFLGSLQDGRISSVELVNGPFPYEPKGTPAEYKAGACRKLNPAILVMQSAQYWTIKNVPGAIDGARNRRIFLQGGRSPHGRANGIRKRNGFAKDCRQAELAH
jgi:hypothetical protein